jgi:serine protease
MMPVDQTAELMTCPRVFPESVTGRAGSPAEAVDPLVIAVLDTGVDLAHPRLRSLIDPGATFVRGTRSPQDDNGHGTGMAGVFATSIRARNRGRDDRRTFRLLPVKVADSKGHTLDTEVASGIRWAVDRGARVLSVSLGTEDIPEMRAAADYAYQHNVLIVAASPGGASRFPAPAMYPHVLAVAACDSSGRPLNAAPHAAPHLIMCPSDGIRTTTLGGGVGAYAPCASIAVPGVAFLAARLFARFPKMTVDGAIAAIERGALTVPGQHAPDTIRGWGVMNVERSLRMASLLPVRP